MKKLFGLLFALTLLLSLGACKNEAAKPAEETTTTTTTTVEQTTAPTDSTAADTTVNDTRPIDRPN